MGQITLCEDDSHGTKFYALLSEHKSTGNLRVRYDSSYESQASLPNMYLYLDNFRGAIQLKTFTHLCNLQVSKECFVAICILELQTSHSYSHRFQWLKELNPFSLSDISTEDPDDDDSNPWSRR